MSAAATISSELRTGTWAAGLPTSGPGGDACASIPPIVGLVFQYVQPLRDMFDQLLGEPAQVAGAAAAWEDASRSLAEIPPTLTSARSALAELDGRTVRALRERHEDMHAIAADAAEWTAATAASLRLASRIVEATRTFVCDLLVQLARFAKELFSFTLNPFEVADRVRDFAGAAADLVEAAGRLVMDLLEALAALASLLQRLLPIVAEALEELREIVAHMLPLYGAITNGPLGFILGGAAENFLQRSSDVEELDPATLDEKRLEAWQNSQSVTHIASLSDLVGVNGTTDTMGGGDATVIDVKKVVAADGSVHWVVSLPSTQDWQFSGDTGALNDRDSNVALMLDNPIARTAYERAVLEAMSDAGVEPGGDVVLTGFSQGGIMAANLAADGTFPYNTVGVVTNGSPVDSFSVPSHIPVYAFQHATDLVPALDGNQFSSTASNVHRVVLAGPLSPIDAHNNGNYTASVRDWEDRYAAANDAPPPYLELFTGEVVDHSVYTAAER